MTDARLSRAHGQALVKVNPDRRLSRLTAVSLIKPARPEARLSRTRVAVLYSNQNLNPTTPGAITWWDGTAERAAVLEGWWDGTTVQPVTLEGWWDGSMVQPLG